MFKNYLKVAIRNLLRQRIYSVINVLGLAIGLACSFIIILYINHEFNFDRFHSKAENIYRISTKGEIAGDFLNVAVSSAAYLPELVREYPEVITGTRIASNGETFLLYNDTKYYESDFYFVDSTFNDVFDFETVIGNPDIAFDEPYSLVLTKTTAEKYFGKENPVGESIRFNGTKDYKVTAVVNDPPKCSHFQFTGLISWNTLYERFPREQLDNSWGSLSYFTYVQLNDQTNLDDFEEKISMMVYDNMKEEMGEVIDSTGIKIIPYLQPLTDIHLHSNLMAEISDNNNDINNIYIFAAIAIFILVIACINFMNLSTARSAKRGKEVGLRKVHGAERKQLIAQFLGESILISLIALVIAVVIVELVLHPFNEVLDVQLNLDLFSDWNTTLLFIGISIFTGIIAGSYPAFYLSAFQPIKVLKGVVNKLPQSFSIRNILVVLQFVVSIALIIGTIIIYNQISYLRNKKLGFDKENVVIIPLRGNRLQENYSYLVNELSTVPVVKKVGAGSSVPGFTLNGSGFIPEGMNENEPWLIYTISVDYSYTESLGMEIVKGRNFSKEFSTDTLAIIVNETLWKKTGWDDPIGKTFTTGGDNIVKVIGVVEDFHFKSLESVIEPILLLLDPNSQSNLNIKLKQGDLANNLELLEEKWLSIESEFPFDYFFLDERLEELYRSEEKMGKLIIYFTILAIFIACLGLFGLASYVAQQKTKEISIRKSLGASVRQIVFLLSKEFTKWVIISNIFAWPLAYYIMNKWLQNFEYATDIALWIFVVSGITAFVIALLTVSYQSVMASVSNPVRSLKYE